MLENGSELRSLWLQIYRLINAAVFSHTDYSGIPGISGHTKLRPFSKYFKKPRFCNNGRFLPWENCVYLIPKYDLHSCNVFILSCLIYLVRVHVLLY